MNRDLLKKIIRQIGSPAPSIKVAGYTQDEVKQVIERLVQEEVVIRVKATAYGLNVLGQAGEPKEIERYELMEYKLKELYHIDRWGNEI